MKILVQHWSKSANLLPLECECGQTILYRIIRPDIAAHCARCGSEENIEHMLTEFLIDEDPSAFYNDPDEVLYDSYEIRGE